MNRWTLLPLSDAQRLLPLLPFPLFLVVTSSVAVFSNMLAIVSTPVRSFLCVLVHKNKNLLFLILLCLISLLLVFLLNILFL
jgi:hypothetical protein